MSYTALAQALQEVLGLPHPPVALSFATTPPEGVPHFNGVIPSACALWRRAEHGVFYAAAEDHVNCPIGALTMGFTMADEQAEVLMSLVGRMGEVGYIGSEEAANIPTVPGEKSGIVYGPLDQLPVEPDVVLLWVTPASAMLLDEATGGSRWTPKRQGIATFGRPSCAAIPMALAHGQPALSVGCTGMRAFTEIGGDLQLAVLPRAALLGLCEALAQTAHANRQMTEYYLEQKARVSA